VVLLEKAISTVGSPPQTIVLGFTIGQYCGLEAIYYCSVKL
jgi:hypothetical protein